MNGGDGMIIFYEYLINEALRIVDLKGTVDDIKAGNDLKEINRIISCLEVNINISLYIQKNIKEERITEIKKRDEAVSDILYLPVVLDLLLVFFNFLYIAYFSQQKDILEFFM